MVREVWDGRQGDGRIWEGLAREGGGDGRSCKLSRKGGSLRHPSQALATKGGVRGSLKLDITFQASFCLLR